MIGQVVLVDESTMNKLLTIGRYALAGLLCYAGSIALFEGVAYYEGVRGQGIPARIVGLASILAGVWLVFTRNRKQSDGKPKCEDPPDFG